MEKNYEAIEVGQEKQPEFCFKIVISGNSGVGKTSIVKYEISNSFSEDTTTTLVFDHYWKNYEMNGKVIRLQIWDMTGNETYEDLMKNFYRSSLCIIIVFSLDNLPSFDYLNKWMTEIRGKNEQEWPILVLIGNKSDNDKERKISREVIEEYCKNNNIENYFETSAKTGEGIHELFKTVVKELYIKYVEPIASSTKNDELCSYTHRESGLSNANEGGSCKKCFCLFQ